MDKIILGSSDLKVSKICLGTMTFGEQVDEASAHSIFDRSLERGVLSHQYHLQYTIYAAALHRYMIAMDPAWDYEKRFGGCHYLFLRAFGDAEEAGDHFHRPKLATIEALLRNVDATFD